MANPVEIVHHLGPYEVDDVTVPMLNDLVVRQKVPIIVHQEVQTRGGINESVYAVLATKDLKIVCSQCFTRDMVITDSSRCKTCSSFVKHWEYRKDSNFRKKGCKEDSMFMTAPGECTVVTLQKPTSTATPESLTDEDLLEEVHKKLMNDGVFKQTLTDKLMDVIDSDVLVKYVKKLGCGRGVLQDARLTDVLFELNRRAVTKLGDDPELYYNEVKVDGHPHKSDYPVGCDITKVTKGTKRSSVGSYKPRAYNDMDEEMEELETKTKKAKAKTTK